MSSALPRLSSRAAEKLAQEHGLILRQTAGHIIVKRPGNRVTSVSLVGRRKDAPLELLKILRQWGLV